MKKALIFISVVLVLNSCISLKEHTKITSGLQGQIDGKQSQLDDLSNQLETNRGKLKKLGDLKVTSQTSANDEKNANYYKDDNSWIPLKNPERYKDYLTGGLGIIWVEIGKDSLIEGGYLNFERYKAEPEILDPGDVIFKYFVNNKFNTKIAVVSAVTASMNAEDFAKLKYEILGTSKLKIPQDSIESIAMKYAKGRYNSEVKSVYLATGFHIRKISLQTYTKMAANAVATVPVANVNGEFFNESESELNNWYVDAKLIDLKFFIPNIELEQKNALSKNQTPFQLLKSIFGKEIPDETLLEIANNPELMTTENIEKLKLKLNKKEIKKSDTEKLNDVGKSLFKSKTDLLNIKMIKIE